MKNFVITILLVTSFIFGYILGLSLYDLDVNNVIHNHNKKMFYSNINVFNKTLNFQDSVIKYQDIIISKQSRLINDLTIKLNDKERVDSIVRATAR